MTSSTASLCLLLSALLLLGGCECQSHGLPDTGPTDAGAEVDAAPDAGRDGGGMDAGADVDAGPPIDAGVDAGTECPVGTLQPLSTAAGWLDYLIQDTCRDADGRAIAGDPRLCPCHSDLEPGERVHSSFKYTDTSRTFVLSSLPRESPTGTAGFVWFDSGNGAGGKGSYDLDDPHCRVPGSLCFSEDDVDIVDLVEAHWDTAYAGRVSIAGTAHIGTGGYLGFTSGTPASGSGGWPDGWLIGAYTDTRPRDVALTVVEDAAGATSAYTEGLTAVTHICSAPLGTVPPQCLVPNEDVWLVADRMYLGHGKTFEDVLISVHSASEADLRACAHAEVFIHSREYGLMSHQTWRPEGCPGGPPSSIGCDDSSMITGPLTLSFPGGDVRLERRACTRGVTDGEAYVFDPDALSEASAPEPYPSARVLDETGFGNVLLDAHGAWTADTDGSWLAFDAVVRRVESPVASAAPRNQAIALQCDGDCLGSSIYQDVALGVRAPGWRGQPARFGARVARADAGAPLSGSVFVFQYDAGGAVVAMDDLAFTTAGVFPDADGTFVEGALTITGATERVRFQVYLDDPGELVVDDLFVTRGG